MECKIEAVDIRAYKVPTLDPVESDGTLEWTSTTMVYVEVRGGGQSGIGYTYADVSAGKAIESMLRDKLVGKDAMDTGARWAEMGAAVRNNGRGGICSMAISAVDVALWDLKGKLLGTPVYLLLGATRDAVPVYGSGGFTSYSIRELEQQLGGWVHELRIPMVKMKVGRDPDADPKRVAAARKAIGKDAQLFVDANGAYSRKQAVEMARYFRDEDVRWYEEPVYHQDLPGNRFVRDHAPPLMEISNGEYIFELCDARQNIDAGAADVLQADVTRCGGFSGILAVDGLCQTAMIPLSTHCAPYVSLHAAVACKMLRHMEYFADHVRIEQMFFDGASAPQDGMLRPDPQRPGIGLTLRVKDAEQYAL